MMKKFERTFRSAIKIFKNDWLLVIPDDFGTAGTLACVFLFSMRSTLHADGPRMLFSTQVFIICVMIERMESLWASFDADGNGTLSTKVIRFFSVMRRL